MADQELRKIIREQGTLTFASFMELVLYHPEYGYYNSEKPILGKEGDFYTSVHVSSLFGEMIAEQLAEMAVLLEGPVFSLAEFGAGKGFLAYDILKTLQIKYPTLFARTVYYIVEASSSLKKEQYRRLTDFQPQVRWVDGLDEVEKPFRGCVLSNELVDAFPVHRVKYLEDQLKEIYVREEEGILIEVADVPSTPLLEAYFDDLNITLSEGQVGEVNLAARDWLQSIGNNLDQGFVLTIDYGYEASLLYHSCRRDGTLMCYYRHQTEENPYLRLGEQDMTAHVNFSALKKWGEENGLLTTGFTNQMHFLFNLGLAEALSKEPQKAYAAQQLVNPEGMGGIFKVLIQHKNLVDPQLKGLKENR
ncbi:SAM-dependent methyltransferase [Dehalobacterium formicoaceticum]|uniref:SAM-dependent methyltransferase n=1 Tax=Dehalobacterium formicoaceticum TaxID=51515 RepID=A0ABT1Y3X6_9FIRM|nr:SAM-dependent methyltransferase [Dehalobacterium formicoaceticum]MCR6545585.1 SAM-dependent methyltransferase [Dehalobacterium formicoaceticum]